VKPRQFLKNLLYELPAFHLIIAYGDLSVAVKTGIVMLNMGGPQDLHQVGPFLRNLFADREIIQLPFQDLLGPFLARRRTRRVQANYQAIGGRSPILHWTRRQGEGMVAWLDRLSPNTAPHQFYVAFRYTHPLSEDALLAMKADHVERAVAFTQYPQFSCSTTGSSLNELWRALRRLRLETDFRWSVIDRWPIHPGFIDAIARSIRTGLEEFPEGERAEVLLLFSAHSLPTKVIARGDPYLQEIGASMQAVINSLGLPNPYVLAFQSAAGPVAWQGPSTERVIQRLGQRGQKAILVVPIAFTSDHIETLSEIDLEYAGLARKLGIVSFKRSPAINGDPGFQRALADLVVTHLHSGQACGTQYKLRCPGCTNQACREIPNPIHS
jgi:protoporphyrin/coproporphyrin ferrochelatase